MNPLKWNWNQWKAAGKHAVSFIAGAVAMAALGGIISQQNASGITENISAITSGIEQVAKGVAGLIAILTPIYTAWRAAHNADPNEQAKSVAAHAPSMSATSKREVLGAMVDQMPGVDKVIAEPALATAIPSNKVVAR